MTTDATALSILFIGGGNMAQAMITGMLSGRGLEAASYRIVVAEPDSSCRGQLAEKWGAAVSLATSIAELSGDASYRPDWIVLAVKPQQAKEALFPVAQAVASWEGTSPCLLSIAAGITVDSLRHWSGIEAVVRTMPNTPAMVQQGVTGAYAVPILGEAAQAQADSILRRLGEVVWVDEEMRLDAVTAISGSGPAYVFYFLEAFAAAGASLGLPERDSETLARQTLTGALRLLEASGESPTILRNKVTSKGGTTAAALGVLTADQGLMDLMRRAIEAAHQRAQEMAKDYAAD